MKIKQGDNVVIISGKDKGKHGKVTRALPALGKIVVEGVNVKKKHQKPRRANQKGQIFEFAAPIDASNAMLVDPKTGKPTRVGYRVEKEKKIRYAKKSGTPL